VSRILGHASTAITERVYARVKQETVGDRILDEIDPTYAKAARRTRRRSDRRVATITALPEPKSINLYNANGLSLTLDAWATRSGIAKSTLYWRVVTRGMSMKKALAMGPGPGRVSRRSPLATRSTVGKSSGNDGTDRPDSALPEESDPADFPRNAVGHDRLELSANGLRVRCSTN
jgi:hypothetical protein